MITSHTLARYPELVAFHQIRIRLAVMAVARVPLSEESPFVLEFAAPVDDLVELVIAGIFTFLALAPL